MSQPRKRAEGGRGSGVRHLPPPSCTRPQVRPAPQPAWARPGVSSCRAAPPPSPGAGSHSPWGFTFSPGPCRLPARGKLQPTREEEGRLLRIHAGGCGASGARASECWAPATAAAAAEQPPHALNARLSRGGAERGPPGGGSRNGSSVGERSQVAFGSSSLGKEVGNGRSTRTHSLKEKPFTL